MKALYLLRHGKSSWDNELVADHERPLNERGRTSAKTMAARILEKHESPSLIVSSSAVRALTTAKIFAAGIAYDENDIHIEPDAYTFEADRVLQIIKGFDDQYASIMLVGHNPGFTVLANRFCHESIVNVPTCGLLKFVCSEDHWRAFDGEETSLQWFDFPKSKGKACHY